MEDWDEVWRRNQFLCTELVRRHPSLKILFVGLPVDISNSIRRARFSNLMRRKAKLVEGSGNIRLSHPVKLLPNSLTPSRKLNEIMFRRHVASAARSFGIRRPLLWLNAHSAVHAVGKMDEIGVIYDITDDWTALTQSRRLRELIIRQDSELCRRADVTIVCSNRLHELKRSICRQLYLIPNGVDIEHYRLAFDGGELPIAAEAWERPVLGYTGTIHPDRVDVDLVEAIAKDMTSGTIVLIGPNHLRHEHRERLQTLRRVVITGAVPYQVLPQYMRAFDVCITPHVRTQFTESLNPIKLWEYLATGKPIVATDVAGFRDYPEFVRIAADAKSFVSAVATSMNEGPEIKAARRAEAARHSWRVRVDRVDEAIQACIVGIEKHANHRL